MKNVKLLEKLIFIMFYKYQIIGLTAIIKNV